MTDLLLHPTVSIGFKAMPLLAIAFGLTQAMKFVGSSASKRSLIWTSCIAGLVLLPVVSLFAPTWHLGVFSPLSFSTSNPEPIGKRPILGSSSTSTSTLIKNAPEAITAASPNKPTTLAAISTQALQPEPTSNVTTNLQWIPLLWSLGFLWVSARTLLGWCSLLSLKHRARECFDEQWLEALQDIKTKMEIQRPIRILMSRHRDIPMTWGIFRPILHLPLTARDWSPAKRQTVLLHEIAHIRRFDSALQLIGQIATAIYWYNPLIWMGIKRLRAEQEAACDDTVLCQGQTATLYAGHLTSIICGRRASSDWESAVTLAAGRPGNLETRIEHILSPKNSRQQTNRRAVVMTMSATLIVTLLVGSISPFTPSALGATQTTRSGDTEALTDLGSLQRTLLEHSFQSVDGQFMKRSAIEAMIRSLNDPHAKYLSAAELAETQVHLDGELFGIGAQLNMVEGKLEVVQPIPGSPALEAGLRSGDIIEAVDDTSSSGLNLTELVKLIRGPLGSTVRLSITRGEERRTIRVERGRIKLPSVHGLRGVRIDKSQGDSHQIGKNHEIAYFQISYFGKHTAAELQAKLSHLSDQNIKGAIMDLRDCPGGGLGPATQVADLFLNSGAIVTIKNREGQSETIQASPETYWPLPLVILINDATASAGEIVCGALQDHERAIILGTRSFGRGSVQTLLHLSDSLGAIRLTTAKYALPHGREIDRLPGATSWGIEANEGYFVPSNDPEHRINARLQGVFRSDATPIQLSSVSPEACRETLHDSQLAAALETLESKTSTGSYKPVGGSVAALHAYIAQQEHQKRQDALLEKLNTIQSAVGELIEAKP